MSVKFQLAQLRHAYVQLNNETVKDQKQFANGLIAPVIRSLEKLLQEEEKKKEG